MHKTREKKKEERIRLKTNGFGRRRRIVASPYTVFLSRAAVSRESEHLAVALVHNTSEVSELLSHHFLSHLERTKLPPPKRTVPRNHAFAVAIPVKPFSNTGIPNKNTEEFTRSAGPSPGDCEATTEPTVSSPALQTPRVCSRRRLSVAPRCRRFIVPSSLTTIGRVGRLPRHRLVVVVRATRPRGPARGGFERDATTTINNNNAKNNIAPLEELYDKNRPLFLFRDVPASERQSLFRKKLQLCSYVFDFTDPTSHVREKEIKRQTLLELGDYVNQDNTAKFTDKVFDDVMYMLSCNLFRALPPRSSEQTGNAAGEHFDPEEEEPKLEPAWPHLQIVYEFLLRCVVSNEVDAKIGKKYVDKFFHNCDI